MHKNELEWRRFVIQAEKFGSVMNLIQHAFTLIAIVVALYLVMTGLNEMVKSNPDALTAMSVVIEKLQINSVFGYLLAAGSGLGWIYERQGKKRAIKKSSVLRTQLEGEDPYSPSSNLDENGHTPK